jgi:hypothetical protein
MLYNTFFAQWTPCLVFVKRPTEGSSEKVNKLKILNKKEERIMLSSFYNYNYDKQIYVEKLHVLEDCHT